MQISPATRKVLENYSGINSNIFIEPGNRIATKSPDDTMLSEYTASETFTDELGLFDLPQFLQVMSLFSNPEIVFDGQVAGGRSTVKVQDGQNSATSVRYTLSSKDQLVYPQNSLREFDMGETVNFTLAASHLKELLKAASVLGVRYIMFENRDGKIVSSVSDVVNSKSRSTENMFQRTIQDYDGEKNFRSVFRIEQLKFVEGDYDITASEHLVTRFTLTNSAAGELVYWVAAEDKGSFFGEEN
jgi:hypothetical protein